MTSQQSEFEKFYEDRVEAHRQLYAQEGVLDRVSQPSIVVSIVILLITVAYNTYGSTATLDGTISLIQTCLWDGLVFAVPARLLYALDNWLNPPTPSQSMLQTHHDSHAAKSEVLRRVLGLDRSGGMMASVFNARTRALSMTGSVLGLKLDSERPPGLGNRDNSCYQNSILQGLASLKSLPEYLSYYLQHSDLEDQHRDVAQTLRSLISDLNDTSNNGKTLWTPSLLKSMSTWTQQDAQEYYSKILDDIDKSIAKATRNAERHSGLEAADVGKDETITSQHSDDSGYQSVPSPKPLELKVPRNPLEGLLAQRVACVQCGHSDGLSMNPFTCLMLSLGLNKNQHDLYERLDSYSKVEEIENVECAKCTLLKVQSLLTKLIERFRAMNQTEEELAEPLRRLEAIELALEEDDFEEKTLTEKCKIPTQSKVSATKTKQIVVARPPQSLAIHINRSVFDPATFDMIKNSAPVSFPMTLDLGPWCLGSACEQRLFKGDQTKVEGKGEEEERWPAHPRKSLIAGDLQPSKLTGPIYGLRAVVTHYGRHENGHYICYRKYPRSAPPPQVHSDNDDAALAHEPDEDLQSQTAEALMPEADVIGDEPEEEWDWWRLSDHNVSKVNEEVIMSLSPGVFMLFYDCVDPSMVFSSDEVVEPHIADGPALPLADTSQSSGEAKSTDMDIDPQRADDSKRNPEEPSEAPSTSNEVVVPENMATARTEAPEDEKVTARLKHGQIRSEAPIPTG